VADPRLIVRVEDAATVPSGGPARIAISGLPRSAEVADAVAAARGQSHRVDDRLVVTAVPSRLVDAAGRVGGAPLAETLRAEVDPAVDAWLYGPGDLDTPAGALPTSHRPLVMGIVNVTPDSFSDGGVSFDADGDPGPAVEAGLSMQQAGADVIDVGGESTRPGAGPVDAEVELARVVPVVERLADAGATVSIDTSKAEVARACVQAGAAIVNDVSAGTFDAQMLPTVAELDAAIVLMHLQGTPRTMQDDPRYGDVVGDVFDVLADRTQAAVESGIPRTRIAVDPGIGFGKTLTHNLELLRRLRELTSLGRPVLVGVSRKGFIGELTGANDPLDRLEGSLAAAALSVGRGARIVRVHDVAATVRAVRVADAIATAELA
jgi:dihydropteroate synthase